MPYTDQFGRVYERLEDFAPAKIVREVQLCETDTGRYLGLLTQYEGIGWTYPGHRFGEPAQPTPGAAWAMFMRRAGVTCSIKRAG
jgi:hypothetical protein